MIGSIFGYFASSALSGIAGAFVKSASVFLQALFTAMSAATSLDLDTPNFVHEFDSIFTLGLLVMIMLALIEIAAGALQRSGRRIAKVPLNMVVMILGTMATIAIVDMLLAATDSLAAGLLSLSGMTLSGTTMTVSLAAIASDPAAAIFVATLVLLAVFACFVTLIVRKVLIVVSVVFAPLALAGITAQSTRSWVRKWIEMTIALIFSKVILVIILVTGFNLLAGAGTSATGSGEVSSITSLLGGVGLLMLASFSPMAAMKMVHFTGGHFEDAARMGHGALSGAAAPQMVKDQAHKAAKFVAGAAAGPAGAAAATGAEKVAKVATGGAEKVGEVAAGLGLAAVAGAEIARHDGGGAKAPMAASATGEESSSSAPTPVPAGVTATPVMSEAATHGGDTGSARTTSAASDSARTSSPEDHASTGTHALGVRKDAAPASSQPTKPAAVPPPADRPSPPSPAGGAKTLPPPRPLPPATPETGV